MGIAQTRTGHTAWFMYGIAALGAHGLLLLSVPSTPVETVIAAASTVVWEAETWELQAPAPEVASAPEPAAIVQAREETNTQPAPAAKSRASRAAKTVQRSAAPTPPGATADASPSGSEAQPRADLASPEHVAGLGAQAANEGRGAASADAGANGTGGTAAANGQGAGALLRAPRLLATRDPCAGFFPGTAEASRGQVQLSVDVDAQGRPHPTQTLLELPRGQGFESAAKACAAHLHFAPALDAQGHPVSARARIALRFERS